ncbi:phosphoesterase PA-phosphatase related protein [Dehalogenimonas lykanthroporepellens BL-DC-9]|jgi:membrane-associated phospholipid phosphatase|nr:phosphoesterase PA-phosphatase related protein [Dehalogenimonas lykanthroporepellens BL-DC-9]
MNTPRIANYISDILNPLVLSLIMLAVVSLNVTESFGQAVLWFVLVTAVTILPVLGVAIFLVRTGRMDALFSNRRHQRHRIYVIGLFFTVMSILLLNWLEAPSAIIAVLVVSLITVVSFAAINLWWKISVHTSTISAFVIIMHIFFGWWAVPTLALVPAMGWARVQLAQHTVGQVVAGALLSAIIVLVIFRQYQVI